MDRSGRRVAGLDSRERKYDRPTWHYQLGASVVIGDVEVPEDPGPLPDDATMETRELYIVQAIELCKKVLHDESQPKADRAAWRSAGWPTW